MGPRYTAHTTKGVAHLIDFLKSNAEDFSGNNFRDKYKFSEKKNIEKQKEFSRGLLPFSYS